MKNQYQNPYIVFLLRKCIFFFPIIVKIYHKPFFSIVMYLNFEFQHINHNYNNKDSIYSNFKNLHSNSNTKMQLFDL